MNKNLYPINNIINNILDFLYHLRYIFNHEKDSVKKQCNIQQ